MNSQLSTAALKVPFVPSALKDKAALLASLIRQCLN